MSPSSSHPVTPAYIRHRCAEEVICRRSIEMSQELEVDIGLQDRDIYARMAMPAIYPMYVRKHAIFPNTLFARCPVPIMRSEMQKLRGPYDL